MWYIDQIERLAKLRHSLVRSRRATVCVQLCLALRALWECLGGGQEPLQDPLTLKTKDRPTEHSLHVLLFNIFLNHKNRLCYLSSHCVFRITFKSHQPFTMLKWHSKHPQMLMKNRLFFFRFRFFQIVDDVRRIEIYFKTHIFESIWKFSLVNNFSHYKRTFLK